MGNKKHIAKFVQIDSCFVPRWGVIKLNVELHEDLLQQERKRPDQSPMVVSHYKSSIFHKLEELKNYNHLFN